MKSFFIFLLSLISIAIADSVSCNSTSHCPEDQPCCSQFGTCGTGAYCLGGCDIRYSYNLTACMPMPRMDSFSQTWDSKDKVKDIELQTDYLGNATEADWVYTGWVDYYDNALLVQMPNGTTGTVLSSTKYLWYGRVGAHIKTSRDGGVVTAFILFSDVQDELDYEFVGYNLTSPQTNFYAQGILNYTNSRNSTTNDTFSNYHHYEIDWQEDKTDWYIDGEKVRTLERDLTWNETTNRYDYPQTPSRIQVSLWPGGDESNGNGTIEWAGGPINWDSEDIQKYGYYYAHVKDITFEAYDIPDDTAMYHGNSTNEADYHAYRYNSTDGDDTNIMLTNDKTWLGSSDATGNDPQNENDSQNSEHTTTIVTTSGSKTITSVQTTTSKASANVPAQNTAAANQQTTDGSQQTTADYNPSAGIGGFVQDARSTASSTTGGGSNIGVGIFSSIALGILSFLI